MRSTKRKGIEPIVSVILLLLITIALAGGVLVWLTGYVGGFQQDIVVKSSTCTINGTGANFRIYVYNAGQSTIGNASIHVNYVSGPSTLTMAAANGTDIPAGQQALFVAYGANATGTAASGTYVLEVVSPKTVERAVASCA